jgi:hypothetical protein
MREHPEASNHRFCKGEPMPTKKAKRYELHRQSYTSTYNCWCAIRQRCHNPRNTHYENYGARGIEVCERWRNSFVNFFEDMGERPIGMTIERKDNNKGYSPDNCTWVTRKHQQRNRRANRRVIAFGMSKTLAEWSEIFGVRHNVIAYRLSRGYSNEDAVSCSPFARYQKRIALIPSS